MQCNSGRIQDAAEGESVQLVQQRRALSLHHMVDLPQSQIAVAQTVGGRAALFESLASL